MERVLGIGGVFFRGRDAEQLREWYRKHLGIDVADWGGYPFQAEAGDVTVWSIFPRTTTYFGPRKQLMVNYRVRDVDAMLDQLRSAGVPVDEGVYEDENGRFGWATDPEGNRVELWEPREKP